VALWAGQLGDDPPVAVRLTARRSVDGFAIDGWPATLPFEPQALLLLPDPFSFPIDELLADVAIRWPGLPVVGGMASAARAPGGNRMALDGAIFSDGCVGAFLGPGARLTTVVSQGCRPIGDPLTVTSADGTVVRELAGEPPLERLVEQAKRMPEGDVRLINQGLHLGIVIDEHKVEFGVGDFLIRNVLGGDQESGAIQVGDEVPVGQTVQFHVRDATSADVDLRELLQGHTADSALLFTCNGRGVRLFGSPDHDASVVADLLDDPPTVGFFAAGELGPVGGRNFLHGFTASVLLFED
jgi:small ligand-binding sensory domain FIST